MAITMDTRSARRSGRVSIAAAAHAIQRARAFAAAKRHSRLVAVLRIVFPFAAMATLVVYALIVTTSWISTAGKFKVGGVEITADDLTMKDPSYFDVTSDGRYEVRARRAVVAFSKKAPIKLIDVSGNLTQKSGTVTTLKAKHGLFDNAKGELELFDGIEIDASNGVMARLSRATIYPKEGKVVSPDPVSATMPTGSVQASAMTMSTKTRLMQFRGNVAVRLLPQQGRTLGTGRDARQPVDVRGEELDIDDAGKTAHFREKVTAVQGETMLQAPYLMLKYEGKAAGLASAPRSPADNASGRKDTDKEGARVTFLWARNGVEITAGKDRRITSELADFDVAGDTALFVGNVVATQEKSVLKGGRLLIDRKAGKTRMETPGPGGRIAASFPQGATAQVRQAKRQPAVEAVQASVMGGFKADRSAPMDVEANTLEMHDADGKAVFSGDVAARQGDLLLRTAELTAFFSGRAGLADAAEPKAKGAEKNEVVRLEAKNRVIMTSNQQSATARWATFDVKANTALLGGGVVVTKQGEDPLKPNTVTTERLRVDLTTGIYQFESDPAAASQAPPRPATPPGPALSASPPATAAATPEEKVKACPPGRICTLFFPQQLKQKALDAVKKKAPALDVPP